MVVKHENGEKADKIGFYNSYSGNTGGTTPSVTPDVLEPSVTPRPNVTPSPSNPPPTATPIATPEPSEIGNLDPPTTDSEQQPQESPDDGLEIDEFGPPRHGSEPDRVGVDGPKTGDESDTEFYNTLFSLGGMMSLGATLTLLRNRKRK